jgi:hypothetical protein
MVSKFDKTPATEIELLQMEEDERDRHHPKDGSGLSGNLNV